MVKCERCGHETNSTICSMFNTENICMRCKEKESQHPLYQQARETVLAAVQSGDYNYPGIGLPVDLKELASNG